MSSRRIVVTDIDGCLTDYPRVFLSWVYDVTGLSFNSLDAMKASMSRDHYEDLKHSYRISGVKRTLPIYPGARETFEVMKRDGMDVWILTRRPSWEPVYSDTKYWLDANNLPYDELFFVSDKRIFVEQNLGKGVRIFIDDSYEIVEFVSSNLDVCAFYLNAEQRVVTDKKIVVINNWKEIQDYLARNGWFRS